MNLRKIYPKLFIGALAILMLITGTPNILGTSGNPRIVDTRGNYKFFPIAKVRPGLTGYGYTVFQGTKIEQFNVKVLAVVSGNRQDKLILVKLDGNLLKENGGLSAGMSGSPVYIEGKLVGAVSYGFENADPFLALITPIETMLHLFGDTGLAKNQPLQLPGIPLRTVPVSNPVLITGMGRRGYELVKKSLQDYGLNALFSPGFGGSSIDGSGVGGPGSGGIENTFDPKTILLPGSAISVQMISGDYQVSALGTVTLIDNQKFLAFGHSFTNKGTVNYIAYNAYIFHTVKSQSMSFKLGAPYKFIGRIMEDRNAGIMGQLGQTPDLISVNVNVKDTTQNQSRNSNFTVINNEQVARELIISGVTDAIDQTIDRVGGGTATVSFAIETKDQTLISRQNMFYGKDIAVDCLKDLKGVLELLATNEYTPVSLKSIKIEVEVHSQQTTARIIRLNCERTKVKPGDTFLVKALVHTYRGVDLTIPFTIELPQNYPTGKMTLMVQSGSKDIPDESDIDPKKSESKTDYPKIDSLPGLLAKFSDTPKNNELVLAYSPANSSKSSDPNIAGKDDPSKQIKVRSMVDYVVFGDAQLTLEIENSQ